jgi:hypothetical protein
MLTPFGDSNRTQALFAIGLVSIGLASCTHRGPFESRAERDHQANPDVAIAIDGDVSPAEEARLRQEMRDAALQANALMPPSRRLAAGEPEPRAERCISPELYAPDQVCAVAFEAATEIMGSGDGTNDRWVTSSTRVVIKCSSDRGAALQPILVLHEPVRELRMGWSDSQTLHVGIPVTATFAPPVEAANDSGRPIAIRYFPTGPEGEPLEQADRSAQPVACASAD